MSDDKQAVVENANPAASPAGDVTTGAQEPTLDQLLEEYDRSVQRQPQLEPTPQPEPDTQHPTYDPSLQALAQRVFMDDVNKTADKVFADVKTSIPQEAKIGWLDQMARRIPEAAAAFKVRHSNPRMWDRWERYLAREAETAFKAPVDQAATEDRDAVAAAVRGASTKVTAEPPPKFGGMSNSEFRKKVREEYGFDPGV